MVTFLLESSFVEFTEKPQEIFELSQRNSSSLQFSLSEHSERSTKIVPDYFRTFLPPRIFFEYFRAVNVSDTTNSLPKMMATTFFHYFLGKVSQFLNFFLLLEQ
jgi:hypothetical protein